MLDLSGMKRPLCDGHVKARGMCQRRARGGESVARGVEASGARSRVGTSEATESRSTVEGCRGSANAARGVSGSSVANHARTTRSKGIVLGRSFARGVVRRCGTCARACELPRRATRHT